MNLIRQGDLLLIPVTDPEEVKRINREARMERRPKAKKDEPGGIVLLAGEATGHHHRAGANRTSPSARSLRMDDQTRFLRTGPEGAELTHEEHDPIPLPPNTTFRVRRQREHVAPQRGGTRSRGSSRRVSD